MDAHFLVVETPTLLPDLLGLKVHAQMVLDYIGVNPWYVLVALGKHILVFLEEFLHSMSHIKSHSTAYYERGFGAAWVQGS